MPLVRPFLLGCLLGVRNFAGAPQVASPPPKPAAKDLCPVCGMLVAKYPNWVAAVVYRDGRVHHFDGPKDLFKYLFDLPKYGQGRQSRDITQTVVTEFYGLKKIDARKALYVLGSDVLGPMGHELVPMATLEDAEEFLRDHRGKRFLRFDQVNREIVAALDH